MAGAILAGNLCLTWTEELYATCGLPADHLARGRPVFDRMRTQLMGGQFLDVVESARPWDGPARRRSGSSGPGGSSASRARSTPSSTRCSSVRPPAALDADDLAALSRYGLDLGQAFQLRDDLLGVFGDPAATGKPAGDDLREGKRTVLLAHALAGTDDARPRARRGRPGPPRPRRRTASTTLREVIAASGAVDAVEAEIAQLADAARLALKSTSGLDAEPVDVLDELIDISTARSS